MIFMSFSDEEREETPGDGRDVVSRENSRRSGAQRRSFEPSVLTLLGDAVHLALTQLQLVGLLRFVSVHGQIAAGKK